MPSSTRIRTRRIHSRRDDAAPTAPAADAPAAAAVEGAGVEGAGVKGAGVEGAAEIPVEPTDDAAPGFDDSGPDESRPGDSGPDESGPDESGPDDSGPDEFSSDGSSSDGFGPGEAGGVDLRADTGPGTEEEGGARTGTSEDPWPSGEFPAIVPVRRGLVGRNPGIVLAVVVVLGLAVLLSVRQLTPGDAATQTSLPLPTLQEAAGPTAGPGIAQATAPTTGATTAPTAGAGPATTPPSALAPVQPTYDQQTRDLQAAAGRALLANPDVTATPAARAELAAGRVDTNLLAVLATAVRETPVTVSSFAAARTDAAGAALRQATVAAPDAAGTRALARVFAAQTGGYAVEVLGTGGPGGTVVRVAGGDG